MKAISFLLFFIFAGCASHEKTSDPIWDAMNSKNDEYRQCYLESDSYKGTKAKESSGVVRVFFIINPQGKATEAKLLESPFKDPNFHACLFGVIRLIKFPLPKDGGTIEVNQPINFHAAY